jgi:hypothetical protein
LPKSSKPRTRTANRFTRPARNDERTEHNFDFENSVSHERTEYNPKSYEVATKIEQLPSKNMKVVDKNTSAPVDESYSNYIEVNNIDKGTFPPPPSPNPS